jgi:hypothetical protein
MKTLSNLKPRKLSVLIANLREMLLRNRDRLVYLGSNRRMEKTITTKQLKSMTMTVTQLTVRQLSYLERYYEKNLKKVKAELKVRRSKHGSTIKIHRSPHI